jgi:phage terminase large subunit-like protein
MAASQTSIDTIASYLRSVRRSQSITDFSKSSFYIPETMRPLTLTPHQSVILEYAFDPANEFTTIVFSTIKKSGKTALAALAARWIAETWGRGEVYCVANDMEQARGRAYQKVIDSIELDPAYNRGKRVLPDRWKIIERQAVHMPSGSILRALSNDYQGESGSNPTATFWTELWAYTSEASRRLWEELTPVPTRSRSIRYVETYAGFEDESDLLIDLYRLSVMNGKQLTHDDINWPFDDQPPIYVNRAARTFAYWDTGLAARRLPWQTPEYYAEQEQTLRPQAFERLHLNKWTSSIGSFIPIEWWYANRKQITPPNTNDQERWLASHPIVLGVDAAVSSDCCAVVAVSRNPYSPQDPWVRFYNVWTPPKGGTMDLQFIDNYIRDICSRYNVVQIAYDTYQLHKLMTDLTHDGVAWCRPFSQAGDRAVADKQLYDLIRDRRIPHTAGLDFDDHIRNAAAKTLKDEDSKLRLIKKAQNLKIDLVVALSMAVSECLRLNL